MIRACVITAWGKIYTDSGEASNIPKMAIDFPPGIGEYCTDVTNQPAENISPSPNLLIVECVVSDATFAAILAHPDYGPGAVLWSEEV